MKLETVKIKNAAGEPCIINADEYDPALHDLYDADQSVVAESEQTEPKKRGRKPKGE